MKTQRAKIKILVVGPVQQSMTVKNTTNKVVMKVVDVPVDNPFGHQKEGENAFDVEVYNHNIELFNISQSLVGETADCELDIRFYQDNNRNTQVKFIVNDLSFRL